MILQMVWNPSRGVKIILVYLYMKKPIESVQLFRRIKHIFPNMTFIYLARNNGRIPWISRETMYLHWKHSYPRPRHYNWIVILECPYIRHVVSHKKCTAAWQPGSHILGSLHYFRHKDLEIKLLMGSIVLKYEERKTLDGHFSFPLRIHTFFSREWFNFPI